MSSQASTSTIGHEENAHDNSSGNPKRLRRNSTRHARPDSYRDGSDSEVEVVESISTEAQNLEDQRHSRGVHGEVVKRADNSHLLGGLATQGYNCENCSKTCASTTEWEDHQIAHSICAQQGHSVTPSTIQQGQSHLQCDRCGMPLKNADLRDRYGNVLTKVMPRYTGGSKKRNGETIESTEEARGWPNRQDQREGSAPRITHQRIAPHIDKEVITAGNTGWPIMAPSSGYMNSNESIYSSHFEPSGNM